MNRVRLHLREAAGWVAVGSAQVRGSILGSGRTPSHAASQDWPSFLKRANGFFALVQQNENTTVLAVDRLRTIPLYYGIKDDNIFVSDDAYWVLSALGGTECDDELVNTEFLLAGYVTGHDTLASGVKQLRAGEFMTIEDSGETLRINLARYDFDNVPKQISALDARDRFSEVLENVFQRVIELANGRPLVIPLSGGLDSRLIALMLKRLRYDNVITYSYGRPDHKEATISREVAKRLNFRWVFVPYSNADWPVWFASKERRDFHRFADTLTAIPHIQDWPAVWGLRSKHLVPDDSIFLPGHSADLLAGSRSKVKPGLYEGRYVGTDRVVEDLLDFHFALWDWSDYRAQLAPLLKARIGQGLSMGPHDTPEEAVAAFEAWDCKERQAKFVINSVRVYEFWGYQWWLPFWDQEFMSFWAQTPLSLRNGKQFYDQFVSDLYRELGNASGQEAQKVANSPLVGLIQDALRGTRLYPLARKVWSQFNKMTAFDHSQFNWYSAIGRERFTQLYTGRETINSFLALERLGQSSPSAVGLLRRLSQGVTMSR